MQAIEKGVKSINLLHYATLTLSFIVSAGYYCIAGEYLTIQVIYSIISILFFHHSLSLKIFIQINKKI
jgi:hypothetical protein